MTTHELRGMYPPGDEMIVVKLSLELALPGTQRHFVNGMELRIDRYMYDQLRDDPKVLAYWLHCQVIDHVVKNSQTHSVFIDPTRYQR